MQVEKMILSVSNSKDWQCQTLKIGSACKGRRNQKHRVSANY